MRSLITAIQAAVLVAIAIGVATLPAAAQPSPAAPTGTSTTGASTGSYPGFSGLQSQNLDTALQFMETMGNQAEADGIRALAEAGDISADELDSGTSGETDPVTGHITIDNDTITPFTRFRNQPPLDGDNPAHLSEIAGLAGTLIHEFTHSGQSYGEWASSNWAATAGYGNASELEGWSAGLSALESWIQSFRDDLRDAQEGGADADEIARLARAVRDLAALYQSLRGDFEKLKFGTITWLADDGTFLDFNATNQMLIGLIDDMETIIAGDQDDLDSPDSAAHASTNAVRNAVSVAVNNVAVNVGIRNVTHGIPQMPIHVAPPRVETPRPTVMLTAGPSRPFGTQ